MSEMTINITDAENCTESWNKCGGGGKSDIKALKGLNKLENTFLERFNNKSFFELN